MPRTKARSSEPRVYCGVLFEAEDGRVPAWYCNLPKGHSHPRHVRDPRLFRVSDKAWRAEGERPE